MVTGKFFGFGKTIASPYDSDAQAVITAIQLSDTLSSGQKDAINNRILAMKSRGTWTKKKAYYGFVGGSAAAHKWNWKDPRDLDASFRLTFIGGWTHSANGAQPNGSTGYGDTHLAPSSVLTLNTTSVGFYSRTDEASGDITEVRAYNTVSDDSFGLSAKRNGATQSDAYSTGDGRAAQTSTDSRGHFFGSRIDAVTHAVFWNGANVGTVSTNEGALTSYNIYIGCRNQDGSATAFSTKQLASVEINNGLTDTEVANEYTDEQAFQTALSRQV